VDTRGQINTVGQIFMVIQMQKSLVKNIIEQKRVEKSANFKKFLSKPKFLLQL